MVSTFTSNLRLTKQGDGDNPNTWGDIVNVQVTTLIEDAIGGVVDIDITGVGNIDIDATTANGATDDARNKVLRLISAGTLGADIELTVPSVQKTYVIDAQWTDLGGPFTVEILPAGGTPGLGVDITTGEIITVYTNGTIIKEISRFPVSTPTVIPSGLIAIWSGTIATIPTGWVLCDGTLGTPDLRDQFVVGASVDDSGVAKTTIENPFPGDQTGGGILTDSQGAHTHTGTTGSHTLTIGEMPSHSHTVFGDNAAKDPGASAVNSLESVTGDGNGLTATTGGGGGHTHIISSDGGHTHDNIPPYFALAYIMKL